MLAEGTSQEDCVDGILHVFGDHELRPRQPGNDVRTQRVQISRYAIVLHCQSHAPFPKRQSSNDHYRQQFRVPARDLHRHAPMASLKRRVTAKKSEGVDLCSGRWNVRMWTQSVASSGSGVVPHKRNSASSSSGTSAGARNDHFAPIGTRAQSSRF